MRPGSGGVWQRLLGPMVVANLGLEYLTLSSWIQIEIYIPVSDMLIFSVHLSSKYTLNQPKTELDARVCLPHFVQQSSTLLLHGKFSESFLTLLPTSPSPFLSQELQKKKKFIVTTIWNIQRAVQYMQRVVPHTSPTFPYLTPASDLLLREE